MRDTICYFNKLQFSVILGGNVFFLSHQEVHPAAAPALSMQSREAGCSAEEPKAAKVHACDLSQHKV